MWEKLKVYINSHENSFNLNYNHVQLCLTICTNFVENVENANIFHANYFQTQSRKWRHKTTTGARPRGRTSRSSKRKRAKDRDGLPVQSESLDSLAMAAPADQLTSVTSSRRAETAVSLSSLSTTMASSERLQSTESAVTLDSSGGPSF